MQTKKIPSSLVRIGTRLMILITVLIALTNNISQVAASLQSLTVGTQSGTLITGTAASATYIITVTRTSGSPNNPAMSVSGLPADVASSFSLLTNWTGSNGSRTYELTLSTTAAVPAGTTSFTVQASTNAGGGSIALDTGTLTINGALPAPTITFNAPTPATPVFPGSDFTVQAVVNSGGALTYSYVSGPCALVNANLGTFSPTGTGNCVVQANAAATASYTAGSAQQSITIVSASAVNVDLCATTGTISLPNGATSVPAWGYALGDCSNSPQASIPGPILKFATGTPVHIILHNNLNERTALLFQGQSMIPDLTGAAPGGTKTYTFVTDQAGTFHYEAGLLANAQHQVAMGMYGAFIVDDATGNYESNNCIPTIDGTAADCVLVLSELDTTLNNMANPAAFDMRKYQPKYFLINGQAYPGTDAIPVMAGDTVLLRYINAGLQAHSMSTLGLSQIIMAQNGNAYHKMVAETIPTGQSLNAEVTVPPSAPDGTSYAIYDANMLLRNNTGSGTSSGFGGMLMFLTAASTPGGGSGGPLTSNVALTPNISNGSSSVTLSANIGNAGGPNVDAAEYFVDSAGANGSGCAITTGLGAAPATVSTTIPVSGGSGSCVDLTILTSGNHTFYVHGQNVNGWGAVASAVLNLDKTGPAISAMNLAPNPSNGSVNVNLTFTASDTANGNSNVTAAEYWIDAGSPAGIPVNAAPIVNLGAVIPAGLPVGSHMVSVRAQDALGNWGAIATIMLNIDNSGPTTSTVSAAPNPNNGTIPFSTSVQAVRVTASFSDATAGNSNLVSAEGFIDTIGTTGTGFVFIASDGIFNSPAESGYSDIPLPVVNSLVHGNHTIYVHAKDAADNWGAMATTILVIDKVAPTVVSINRLDPSPTSATSVQFLVTFSESVLGVTNSNFTVVMGSGLTGANITSVTGSGSTRTVTLATGSGGGTLGLNLTSATGITDLVTNPLSTSGLPFVGQVYTLLTPPLYFSTSGNTNPPGVGGTADDADIYFWNGAAFSRAIDVTAITNPLPGGANVDGFDRVDATHFYMSFNGQVTVPGIGNVQDEDVVYYNAGTWSLYYDGSVNGITSNVDAISIAGGNLYLSLDTNTSPPGAGGTGDDADIYRWNGGSSYTRVVDASTIGIPSSGGNNANVDGAVWVDATHFYMSFTTDTTITGLGAVQDEDVVYYNAGTWFVYFDGTAKGLTSGNLDVDAFDLP